MDLEQFKEQAKDIITRRPLDMTEEIIREMDGVKEGIAMAPYHLKTIREVFTGSPVFKMSDFPDFKKGFQDAVEAVDYLAALKLSGLYMEDDGRVQTLGTKNEEEWRNDVRSTIRQKFSEADIDFDTAEGRVLLNANIYYAHVGTPF